MTRLVIVCATVSVVALAAVIVGAVVSDPERQTGLHQLEAAIDEGAEVLQADRHGAITLTANGKVRGFRRDGGRIWQHSLGRTSSTRRGVEALCATNCPAAILVAPSELVAVGDTRPTESLVEELNRSQQRPLAMTGVAAALTRMVHEGREELLHTTVSFDQGEHLNDAQQVGVGNPKYVGVAKSAQRAVVGSAGGSIPPGRAKISAVERDQEFWNRRGAAFDTAISANPCISADGELIGVVGTEIRAYRFGQGRSSRFGDRIVEGTCTIDRDGISVVSVEDGKQRGTWASRYSHSGRRLWRKSFGSARLLSNADAERFVFRSQASGKVISINAISGRQLLKAVLPRNLFAADDGSLVTANRAGEPRWIAAP